MARRRTISATCSADTSPTIHGAQAQARRLTTVTTLMLGLGPALGVVPSCETLLLFIAIRQHAKNKGDLAVRSCTYSYTYLGTPQTAAATASIASFP